MNGRRIALYLDPSILTDEARQELVPADAVHRVEAGGPLFRIDVEPTESTKVGVLGDRLKLVTVPL